ncbi:hypothetical protein O181_036097 [Austropuccinia psidii MF-1]|uniref:Uncharacterized protein n=1 Tax=Austropuccinia psidii MF-1 TaxID=1389203 RepID=A0A9Q3D9Z9_9BASI|nr:hypothetical protein [Austropuccinia psidii MF-1]
MEQRVKSGLWRRQMIAAGRVQTAGRAREVDQGDCVMRSTAKTCTSRNNYSDRNLQDQGFAIECIKRAPERENQTCRANNLCLSRTFSRAPL